MMIVRHENAGDAAGIRRVNEMAFDTVVEAKLVDKLRERGMVTFSLVAIDVEQIVGHILFSPVTIESGGRQFPALGLGPMAVLPEFQNRGIGSRLVITGLDECRQAGHESVVVVGHPEYYPRFGFIPASRFGLRCEYDVPDEVFMALELHEGALSERAGLVRYQPEFNEA
ncbi:MAG TPA: N-acetyltransferase [Blastocatellia bacterium]|nr:N-acetyltransferase [Blastocatellia bacterium]